VCFALVKSERHTRTLADGFKALEEDWDVRARFERWKDDAKRL
jgi:hypothetical protein